jgi:hypothetical protein
MLTSSLKARNLKEKVYLGNDVFNTLKIKKCKQADNSVVGGHTKHRVKVDVMWKKPEDGWIRLNTNGASKRDISALGSL